jgi:glycine betaine/proline transport system substrate-binding protein
MSLTKAASTKFASNKSNKPVLDFIRAYSIPTAAVNKSLAFYMDESGGDMEETAKYFLSNNSMWMKWVPADVADKIKATL